MLEIGPKDMTFSSSKLYHAYGLGNGLMFPFHVGATTMLYPGRPRASTILEMAHIARPTVFFSVPTLYAAMLQETDRPQFLRPQQHPHRGIGRRTAVRLKSFESGRNRFGVEILDGIGSTEALHIYLSARAGKVRPGSTGQPVRWLRNQASSTSKAAMFRRERLATC